MNIVDQKIRKGFSHTRDPAMSPRGGLTMGRTAEGRSQLVELADDSTSSAEATIPSSPRRSVSMTEETAVPLCFERRGSGTTETRDERLSQGQTSSHS